MWKTEFEQIITWCKCCEELYIRKEAHGVEREGQEAVSEEVTFKKISAHSQLFELERFNAESNFNLSFDFLPLPTMDMAVSLCN